MSELKKYLPADGDFVAGLMEFNKYKHSHPSYAASVVYLASEASALIAELRRQIAELEPNARRYEWLRENADIVFDKHVRYVSGGQSVETRYPTNAELSIAIDSALQQERGKE